MIDSWLKIEQPKWSAYREISHGFLTIHCSDSICKIKFVKIKNNKEEITDEFWIQKSPRTYKSILKYF